MFRLINSFICSAKSKAYPPFVPFWLPGLSSSLNDHVPDDMNQMLLWVLISFLQAGQRAQPL